VTALTADLPTPTRVFSVYQPIVAADGRVVGFEALLRGERGGCEVGAATLFAEAAAHGDVRALDRRAAASAVDGAVAWLDDRLLFVNLAPVSFLAAATWLDALLDEVRRAGLQPTQVVVELNEEQSGEQLVELAALLAQARRSGLRLALDDVLGDALTEIWTEALRPDFIKLDGSLVAGLPAPGAQRAVHRVCRVAARVGAAVVAEQVETQAQLDLLRRYDIELFQGWLTGAPVPAEELGEGLAAGTAG
jgi:EAL domain-containing protein (putative c-di-GMP-specific phosphodiesterase class I)